MKSRSLYVAAFAFLLLFNCKSKPSAEETIQDIISHLSIGNKIYFAVDFGYENTEQPEKNVFLSGLNSLKIGQGGYISKAIFHNTKLPNFSASQSYLNTISDFDSPIYIVESNTYTDGAGEFLTDSINSPLHLQPEILNDWMKEVHDIQIINNIDQRKIHIALKLSDKEIDLEWDDHKNRLLSLNVVDKRSQSLSWTFDYYQQEKFETLYAAAEKEFKSRNTQFL